MLGHMFVRALSSVLNFAVSWTTRLGEHRGIAFDATAENEQVLLKLLESYGPFERIVNHTGILHTGTDVSDAQSVAIAKKVNWAFPHQLAVAAAAVAHVIHIATVAVFPSRAGRCVESARQISRTPMDGHPHHRRGRLEWMLARPGQGRIKRLEHQWVGATTLQVEALKDERRSLLIGGLCPRLPWGYYSL